MYEIVKSDTFERWIDGLRDRKAVFKINARLKNISLGNLGDVAPVGDGVSEIRIHHGPGYRVYFIQEDRTLILLLCGGDKSSQQRDIKRAKKMAEERRR